MLLKLLGDFSKTTQYWKQKKHFCHHAQISWIFLFLMGGGIFNFVFFSHFLTKQKCFWAHLQGNCPKSWKNILLLPLFHFFKPQKALKPKSYIFTGNFVEAWKGLLDSWQAYFIKWTTSGSPPVGLQGRQDSKWGQSWVILYVTNWSSPCRLRHLKWCAIP